MPSSTPQPTPGFTLAWNDGTLGVLGVITLLVSAVLWSAHAPMVERTDFALTYVGARLVHQGMGRDLYNISLQKQLRDSLFQHPSPLLFEHPPFEAFLLSPLAALPFRTAYMLWGLLNAGVWVALMLWLRPYLRWPREDLAYLCLWLLFAPLGVSLYQGQSSLLLLAVYATTFVLLKRGKEFAAGMALGLGLIKFQFVLPFAVLFVLAGKWRFLRGFLASSLLLSVLSLATVGVQGIKLYVRLLMMIATHPQNLSYGSAIDMPTIYGFVFAILGRKLNPAELNVTVGLATLLLLTWIGLRWKSVPQGFAFDLIFSAGVAASLVSGSHMFTHDFSPLALALFISAARFAHPPFSLKAFSKLRFTMMATRLLFWAFPVYFLLVFWHRLYLMCPALLLFTGLMLEGARFIDRPKPADLTCVVAEC